MRREFSLFQRICFCGHSHLPGYFVQAGGDKEFEFVRWKEMKFSINLASEQWVICCVGSVGQPRVGGPRAKLCSGLMVAHNPPTSRCLRLADNDQQDQIEP